MRPALVLALRAAVTVAGFVLAWKIGHRIAEDGPRPADLRPGWLALGFTLHLAILWGLGFRLRLMLAVLEARPLPGLGAMLRMHWAALGVSQVALGTIGGDALRVALLAGPDRPVAQAVRLVLADRVIGLAGLVLVGGLALGVVLPGGQGAAVLAGLGLAAAAGIALVLALARRAPAARGLWAEPARLAAILAALIRRPLGWACLGLAMATHLASALLFLCCALALGLQPPVAQTLVAVPAALLVSTIPASLGGWGLREASIAAAYRLLGTTFPGAVTVSILYGLTHVAMGLPGLLSLWQGPKPGLGRRSS